MPWGVLVDVVSKYWKPLVILLAFFGVGLYGWNEGRVFGEKQIQARWDKDRKAQEEAYQTNLQEKERALATLNAYTQGMENALNVKLLELQQNYDALSKAIPTIKTVKETVYVPGQPPVVSLSDDFGLCYYASLSQEEPDIRACVAAGVHVGVQRQPMSATSELVFVPAGSTDSAASAMRSRFWP